MFNSLGHFIVRHRKSVLILYIITILVAGGIGTMVFGRLDTGGYTNPASDSEKARVYLEDTFKVKDPAVILMIDSEKPANDPTVVEKVRALEAKIATEKGVVQTLSYWSTGFSPSMLSTDGKAGFLFIYGKSAGFDEETEGIGKFFEENYAGTRDGLTIYAGGLGPISHQITTKISSDLKLAESISIPLTFILLAFVFGALAASTMPLIVGVTAILGAFFILYLFTLFTDVSIYALNLTTGMGLGLGIDYALLMVNRFREEIHHAKSVEEAVATTVETAGKTVFYSGLTVLLTLGSLVLFPLPFLKSFGYAGIAVVALAILGAVILLPALMAIIGTKIDKGVVRKSAITPKEEGRWAQTARFVMRRPTPIVLVSLIILGVMAAPLKSATFSQTDARVLPADNPAAVASQFFEERFSGQTGAPTEIVIPGGANKTEEIAAYSKRLAAVKNVVLVNPPQTVGTDVRISLVQSINSRSLDAQQLIHDIRKVPAPEGTLVGGAAAEYTDSQDGILSALPWALLWITITVLILIFIFTGSIILPIKAVLLNALSLGATLGAMQWVFGEGHMRWLIGDFTVTGSLDTSIVVLIAVVVFGLSMDYELFLLSRIREEHLAGHSNVESVAKGLQRSARIITAAAVLLAVVFAAFVTSGVTSIKFMGLGVAFAVLLDATLIRALLVPALMRLFGELNWWAPKSLQRFTMKH